MVLSRQVSLQSLEIKFLLEGRLFARLCDSTDGVVFQRTITRLFLHVFSGYWIRHSSQLSKEEHSLSLKEGCRMMEGGYFKSLILTVGEIGLEFRVE